MKNYLYGYLFSFNPHKNLWYCFKSEDKELYFNEGKSEYCAKDILHILEVLHLNNTKSEKIDEDKLHTPITSIT